jgi:hypothetical protein
MHAILNVSILLVSDAALAGALTKVIGMISSREDVESPPSRRLRASISEPTE